MKEEKIKTKMFIKNPTCTCVYITNTD